MGIATTRSMERVAAALGELENAQASFEIADDIPNGGVLCALPALLAFGLLRHSGSHFTLPKGFYPLESVFLLLAYLALGRIPSMEQLRYQAPGEWGKLLGLDRIPEVKTLRAKVAILGDDTERKFIAYRAETALVNLARETLTRSDDARSLVRGLMKTTINLRPDSVKGELRIELHGQANPLHDAVVTALCHEHQGDCLVPDRNFRGIHVLGGSRFPGLHPAHRCAFGQEAGSRSDDLIAVGEGHRVDQGGPAFDRGNFHGHRGNLHAVRI